eukprot:636378-Amphidinium_carterae.1
MTYKRSGQKTCGLVPKSQILQAGLWLIERSIGLQESGEKKRSHSWRRSMSCEQNCAGHEMQVLKNANPEDSQPSPMPPRKEDRGATHPQLHLGLVWYSLIE